MDKTTYAYFNYWDYDIYAYGRTCWTNSGVPFCDFHEFEPQYRGYEHGLYMVTQTSFMTESGRAGSPYAGWVSYTNAAYNYPQNNGRKFIHIISPANAWSTYYLEGYWTGYMWEWYKSTAPIF